jgi:hypothetical protein
MKKYNPPENTGPPGGRGSGGGPGEGPPGEEGPGGRPPRGGGLPVEGNLPGARPQPNDKTWRSLPNHFNGTRSKVNNFIDELKNYLCINQLNAGLQSLIMKAAFALTLIKGPKVAG